MFKQKLLEKYSKKEVKKMKKCNILALTLIMCFGVFSFAYAVTTTNVTVSAQVPANAPDMTVLIKELTSAGQNPWTGTDVTTMTFGQLTHTLAGGVEAGLWFSNKYYCVIIFTNSFGNRYQVLSTGTGLTSGAVSLPAGSFGLTPGYASQDLFDPANPLSQQGPQPIGSVLGAAGSAVGPNKVVYQSEAAATGRILRAFYSIPPFGIGGALPYPGYTPIPLTQAAGTYAGTVTITIAAF